MFLTLLLISSLFWQEDFSSGLSTLRSQIDYPVVMEHRNGKVFLRANPKDEGFASAWMYVEKLGEIPKDACLKLLLRGNGKSLRLRYFYYNKERGLYFSATEYVNVGKEWKNVELPFSKAEPFYSSNFPYSLLPDKFAELFLFIENGEAGDFDIALDNVGVVSSKKGGIVR